MKSNSRIGWISGAFLVGAVLIGYQMLPQMQEAKGDEPACSGGNGCPPGVCCVVIQDWTGGCTTKSCCASGENLCYLSESRVPSEFPKIKDHTPGNCFEVDNVLVDRCTVRSCSGTSPCTQSNCFATGDPEITQSYPPKLGVPCPTTQE